MVQIHVRLFTSALRSVNENVKNRLVEEETESTLAWGVNGFDPFVCVLCMYVFCVLSLYLRCCVDAIVFSFGPSFQEGRNERTQKDRSKEGGEEPRQTQKQQEEDLFPSLFPLLLLPGLCRLCSFLKEQSNYEEGGG